MSRREIWLMVLLVCGSLLSSAFMLRPMAVRPNIPQPAANDPFTAVRTIMQAADRTKTRVVAQGWRDFAWVVERDQSLKTTGDLRSAIQRFEELLFAKTNLAGAFPGFSAAANEGLTKSLGDEDRPLDRSAAVAALRSLADACEVLR